MTIRQKLLFVTILPVVLALGIGSVFMVTYRQLQIVEERSRAADRIVTEVFELNMLTFEYV